MALRFPRIETGLVPKGLQGSFDPVSTEADVKMLVSKRPPPRNPLKPTQKAPVKP